MNPQRQLHVPELLYKYRSLCNLERFLDIIIDRKLYGAFYKEMNDPMEGYFQYDPFVDKDLFHSILDGKNKRLICSLSSKSDIGLMWTHYADENKGCCLEVEVTSKTWERVEVSYASQIPELNVQTTIRGILGVKAKMWEYEKEIRYLSPILGNAKIRPQLTVKIHRIILGYKVDRYKFCHLRKIIQALNPSITVEKMRKDKLDYGFK